MTVPVTSPIYLFIARRIGILPTDVQVVSGVLVITIPAAEASRRSMADVRYELDRVYGQRYDKIQLIEV